MFEILHFLVGLLLCPKKQKCGILCTIDVRDSIYETTRYSTVFAGWHRMTAYSYSGYSLQFILEPKLAATSPCH